MEDLAYRRLLDLYYTRDGALPCDVAEVARLIRMKGNAEEVGAVLREFFNDTPEGWTHDRADAEITKFKAMGEGGRRGAAKRWAKGGDSPPIDPPMPTKNQNQEPITKEKRVARGSRMPADWTPDAEGEKFAATFGLGRSEIEKFRDYWAAQPGQKGVKLDWPATWRNWCRNAQQARASPYAKPDPSVTVPSRADEKSKAWIEAHASTEEQTPDQREATAQRLRETRQKLRAA